MMNKARLVLGTAQLGGNYGIANTAATLSVQQRNELLQYALSSGIGYLDTAPGYGDSESIIGDCLEDADPQSKPQIVTKLPSVQRLGLHTEEARRRFVTASVRSSLTRLKCSALDVCLLHDPLDLTYQGGEILRILQELKQQQLIRRIGVSVYDAEDIANFMREEDLDSIQIPLNVLDQRWITNEMLERLARKGIEIFVRSVYLQGLLLMAPEQLPAGLKQAEQPLLRLIRYSEETGIPVKELCFLYVRDLPGISGLVIGCETVEQVQENLRMMALPPLSRGVRQKLGESFTDIPVEIIDPRRWK
ncbi:aryl-alcohol dehydrogenase-like predicted oxidoreductase [Paenibacillus silagei]|uniref:Aryl-alcohol dehydrogenase-like predicted oxidoreductase n=2 Tax=Paenibacillus silagei TaxID=1670801 RepID=A0ABS4NQP0_9BACL|nr:aryl-alcohol dehydrogenase-like predicted oxidoreductase [Paenibacillus silagei]